MEKSRTIVGIWEVFHIFHNYLEQSIPKEEWEAMSVEEALQLARDVNALVEGTMSPSDFGKKYRLPRRKASSIRR